MDIVIHHAGLVDGIAVELISIFLVAGRQHDIELGDCAYARIADRYVDCGPFVEVREVTGVVALLVVGTIRHREPHLPVGDVRR